MLNIVLFGPPGAGKGTQSDKLIDKYKLLHLSTGDILRSEIKEKTKLGMEAKGFMDKGELVPDDVVIGMICSIFDKSKDMKGCIFDGFPRTIEQADALDKLMKDYNSSITAMIALDVEHNELVKRLLNRGKLSGRDDDKNSNVIEKRIEVYKELTLPVINYYSAQNKYFSIDGMGSIDEIFNRISTKIDEIK